MAQGKRRKIDGENIAVGHSGCVKIWYAINKEKGLKIRKTTVFVLKTVVFGPSGETRTPGF